MNTRFFSSAKVFVILGSLQLATGCTPAPSAYYGEWHVPHKERLSLRTDGKGSIATPDSNLAFSWAPEGRSGIRLTSLTLRYRDGRTEKLPDRMVIVTFKNDGQQIQWGEGGAIYDKGPG